MKDITHIERPNLPWRSELATECGLDASRHPTWTRDEAVTKARELGRQRFAMVVCMTCMNTAERHQTWEQDPASCLERYCIKYQRRSWVRSDEEREDVLQFDRELLAIALLVEAHREEFDETVAGLGAANSLVAARAAKQKKVAR